MGESGFLGVAGFASLCALAFVAYLARYVLSKPQGNETMEHLSKLVQQGAAAFLKREYTYVGAFVAAIMIFFVAVGAVKPDLGIDWRTAVAFLFGAVASALAGILGMTIATRANSRTAAAAQSGGVKSALDVAVSGGAVMGMGVVGIALLGLIIVYVMFDGNPTVVNGYAMGASLLALFGRSGGGIFTKGADMGADLVGKVEAGIPEDDPRNPATIADNVGDNVGDCAGMAADLFESFGVILVASIILGITAFNSVGIGVGGAAKGIIFPLAIMAIGLLASAVSIFTVKARADETDALPPINRGVMLASVLTLVGTAVVAFGYVGNPEGANVSNVGLRFFLAILAGIVLGQVASRITQYYTSTSFKPVRDIAESGRTGPATVVLSGISSGMESAVWAVVAIAARMSGTAAIPPASIAAGTALIALLLALRAWMPRAPGPVVACVLATTETTHEATGTGTRSSHARSARRSAISAGTSAEMLMSSNPRPPVSL